MNLEEIKKRNQAYKDARDELLRHEFGAYIEGWVYVPPITDEMTDWLIARVEELEREKADPINMIGLRETECLGQLESRLKAVMPDWLRREFEKTKEG